VLKEIDSLTELINSERAENIEIFHTDSGFLKVILKAPEAITVRNIDDPYTEMPKGLTADFLNRDGLTESFIKADYGISYEVSDLVVLKKNVEVQNIKNEKLNTEELNWDRKTKKIYTEKFVTITTPTETLSGYEMEADEDFSNWVIKKASGKVNLAP
jgi:LPS export ABC transporter protein LptC